MQDGPFADLRPIIYNHTYVTHCLSRGFNDPKRNNSTGEIVSESGVISGEHYKPEAIGEILRIDKYEEFGKRVEERLHNGLHQSVGGDFRAMTAANGLFSFPPFFHAVRGVTATEKKEYESCTRKDANTIQN